ncbi:MAG: NAD(P)H-dependent oxidoreductase subunit E [Ignavibacteriae bacterium]|nr:MAG: NAD(P)H-dependent oxidoreductase subunit E [Ignavibacteriota bacterium]
MEADVIDKIIEKHPKEPSSIIQVLLDVQSELYYLPEDVLKYVSAELKVPISRTYNLATFYKAFSLKPKGKHPISVCTGTACYVEGADKLMEQFERELGIKDGETTADKKFSLESVRCLGCCGLAPVVTVGKNLHGKLPSSKVGKILKQYK